MKKVKPSLEKPKFRLVTDPEQVAMYKKQGKYKSHLPHWVRNDDGSLWVEVPSATLAS